MVSPLEAFDPPFMQTAALELLLLSVAGGLVGTWVVLRRLAFFAHAVGTATFPGLVVAEAATFSPQVAGLAVALGYAGGLERVRGRRDDDAFTGLLLVAALATGVVLASDLLGAGQSADRLLFGTLIGLTAADVWWSAGAAAVAVLSTFTLGRAWTAAAFDPVASGALDLPRRTLELALLGLVASCTVTALPAVGALLVGALFVVPAATVRLLAPSVPALLVGSVVLAAVEGLVGLYVAYGLDVSPGPAVAVVASATFALVAILDRRRRT
jgi:ABC-type Mn2+/Zn2+ transport system permease subunit